ncbi:hypothetical protein CNR22_16310 [Sphingobacteriaceae bacterium]|nr:hypothetical protein CNR22_16310 [Sphingobacteriaceae bacterium]
MSITEFFYPLIAGKPFFGSFRKTNKTVNPITKEEKTLDEKMTKAKVQVEEIKEVQKEVNAHYKTAEQLKEEADNLLNKPKE